MKELVTIIVPVYNVEKYLNKCIESIIRQSYKNLEIIFVDDGSTDDSGQILDKYAKKDDRIVVIHKENGGVSSARNTGLNCAKGDYICFCDADDYLIDDYVEYLLNMILLNDADISLTKNMFSNFDNKQIENDKQEIYSGENTAIDIMLYNIPIGVYCKMFKKEFLDKNNIRFIPDIFIGEGFNFNVDSFQRANKVLIGYKKVYYYRRDNETSATTKFSIEKWKNGLNAIDVMKKRFVNISPKLLRAWRFAKWRTNVDVYSLLVTSKSKSKYKEFYKKCKRNGRKYFYLAFINPTSKKEKARAILMLLYPSIIPKLVVKRRRRYSVNISN